MLVKVSAIFGLTSLTPHITILKKKYLISIQYPQISIPSLHGLQLYKSLIHLQLDNGYPVYSHSSKSFLKLLNTIRSSALRLALGTLHSSSTLSRCAQEANPLFQYHFLILTTHLLAFTGINFHCFLVILLTSSCYYSNLILVNISI